jgi:hypothetical protein
MTPSHIRPFLLAIGVVLGGVEAAHAQPYSQLTGVDGETVFSVAFIEDLRGAEDAARIAKSVGPIAALFAKYSKPEENVELELTLGLHHSQRTGMVDPRRR